LGCIFFLFFPISLSLCFYVNFWYSSVHSRQRTVMRLPRRMIAHIAIASDLTRMTVTYFGLGLFHGLSLIFATLRHQQRYGTAIVGGAGLPRDILAFGFKVYMSSLGKGFLVSLVGGRHQNYMGGSSFITHRGAYPTNKHHGDTRGGVGSCAGFFGLDSCGSWCLFV
jgi:hypothetical protein